MDDEIVGYASVAVRDQLRFYKVKRVGAISGLMVAKEHRRQGIATRLLAEARDFFRRHGIRFFTVYTAAANQGAIELYEHNGMSVLHTTFIGETEA
jgi:ribosomal protein S18 acetylase RimI-like enzyme